MAEQKLRALKDFKYRTRMMRAGDDVEMSGPDARLYAALGAVGPRGRRVGAMAVKPQEAPKAAEAPKPAAKAAPRKRTAKKGTRKATS